MTSYSRFIVWCSTAIPLNISIVETGRGMRTILRTTQKTPESRILLETTLLLFFCSVLYYLPSRKLCKDDKKLDNSRLAIFVRATVIFSLFDINVSAGGAKHIPGGHLSQNLQPYYFKNLVAARVW